jgi:hypothetical protein
VAVVATLMVVRSWRLGDWLADFAIFGFMFAAPVLLVVLLHVMWLSAGIGMVISEAFGIRSFIFHVGNGAVSAFIGWSVFGYESIDHSRVPVDKPLPVLAAGLAGGLAYWAIAGFSAGFWKPVFRASPGAKRCPANTVLQPPENR